MYLARHPSVFSIAKLIMNMKTKLLTIISVIAVSGAALIFINTTVGQEGSRGGNYARPPAGANQASSLPSPGSKGAGGAPIATPITAQDAAKKYPSSSGRYPMGERDPHKPSGVVSSPYPPRQEYDCSNVAHGGLVIDTRVNKVFVRP
jgi:hypothetical protein